MEIAKLKEQIQTGKLDNLYVFSGEEIAVQNIYIQNIAKRTETVIERVDSIDSTVDSLKRKTLIKRNRCVVARDDKSFMQDERLQDSIESLIGDNIIILIYTTLDKRTKFYKKYKDRIIEFEPLPEQLLVKYIKKELNLSANKCSKLIEVCESSYGRILLEIDKVKQYRKALDLTRDDEMTDDYFFDQLIKNGTIYQPPKDAIFDFVDAVLRRKSTLAFDLLRQCYAVGEATMVLLSVLYTNVKQVLQVQSYKGNNIEKGTGLTSWQIKCAKDKMEHYSIGELVYMMRLIQKVEQGIKEGKVDEDIAVDYILVNIF